MKGCFLLQRRFAYLGHYIALGLKERYGVDEFCGYVYTRDSLHFLRDQTDMVYGTLLLDEELHKQYLTEKVDLDYIKKLEEAYGIPNLWPYILIDRIIMSNQLVREYPYDKTLHTHEELMRMFQVRARAIISMLETERPDFLFGNVFAGMGSHFLYHVAKKMNIKLCVALPSVIRNGQIISDNFKSFSSVDKKMKDNIEPSSENYKVAELFLQNFRNRPKPQVEVIAEYMDKTRRRNHMVFLKPKNILRFLKFHSKTTLDYIKNRHSLDYSDTNNPWYVLVDKSSRKMRNLIGVSDLYDKFESDIDYAFFPLHYEPEAALLLNAPDYTDQVEVIKKIARALPLGFKLYVKEHPQMVEYRARKFYKQIKKNKNVKLINPSISGYDLINNSKLITTITGTVGFEGVMSNKPVITFGDWFYNTLSSVKKCENILSLSQLIKEVLKNYKPNEQELIKFIGHILDDGNFLDLYKLWEREPDLTKKKEGVDPMVDLLARHLQISK